MIDLSRVENYYVACGYTDLRQELTDGRYSKRNSTDKAWRKTAFFFFADAAQTASKSCTGVEMATYCCISD